MSHLQPGISGGHLPVNAFYIPPPQALATSSVAHKVKQKLVFATPTATARPLRVIQTAAIIPTQAQRSKSYYSSSLVLSASSSMPSATIVPPSINPPPYDSSFGNDKSASTSDNGSNVPWLAPLLGVFGAMGVMIVASIYFVRRRRYRSSSRSVVPNDPRHPRYPKPITSNKHSSWASLSTINTSTAAASATTAAGATAMSGEDKTPIHMLQPPPAYSMTTAKTPVQQKRLTADTLVDEPSLSMLKSQYSPQLAFSPSLVAGEFQQQLDHPPLPNTATLSPSNTLIDNAGVLSNDKNQNYYSHDSQQQRIKIEMYDPQVNLHGGEDDEDDGFGAPYNKSYPNHQEEKVNAAASEGDKHNTAANATANTEHQVINMSNSNQQ